MIRHEGTVIIAEETPADMFAIAMMLRCVTDAAKEIGNTELIDVISQQQAAWHTQAEAARTSRPSPFLVAAAEAWRDGMDTQSMLEGIEISQSEQDQEIEAASEEILRRAKAAPEAARPLLRVVLDEAAFNQLQPTFMRLRAIEEDELRQQAFEYLANS